MSLDTYGHVFDELQGTGHLSAEEQIRRARAKYVSVLCPFPAKTDNDAPANFKESPQMRQARSRTRTDDPFLTMEARATQSCGRLHDHAHEVPAVGSNRA